MKHPLIDKLEGVERASDKTSGFASEKSIVAR
jgi:hypothetical protein